MTLIDAIFLLSAFNVVLGLISIAQRAEQIKLKKKELSNGENLHSS